VLGNKQKKPPCCTNGGKAVSAWVSGGTGDLFSGELLSNHRYRQALEQIPE
jgi:hypothetical protein